MDLTLLSWTRTQFMGSLGFLVFFMSVSLGLSWMLLLFKWRAGRGGNVAWLAAYRFWVRIFALALVLVLGGGVAVLFQMGGLWSGLMERIGNIAGPLLGYAVISVFVFKSCFLGVMLFGQRRVSERMHTFAVAMVAIGQCVALFWLVVLQAWLENPQGARLFEGRFQVYDWAAVILHGSLTWRMGVLACSAALAAAFLILGVTAGQALRRKLEEGERLAFHCALVVAAVASLLQFPLAAGTYHQFVQLQPAKAAAIAGYWETGSPPDLVLMAWPDAAEEVNRGVWRIRDAGAFMLAKDDQGAPVALDKFSGMRPPVAATFLTWRAVGVLALVMTFIAWAVLLRVRGRGFDPGVMSRRSLRLLSGGMCLGAVASVLRVWGDFLGLSPYLVLNTVTQTEVLGPMRRESVMLATLGYGVLYAVLMTAFFVMLFHAARYGVVPVRRVGRKP